MLVDGNTPMNITVLNILVWAGLTYKAYNYLQCIHWNPKTTLGFCMNYLVCTEYLQSTL